VRARELVGAAARVDDDQRARVRRREQAPLEQRRVEAQDRVGALDVAADAHRLPVDADVRRDGRAAPRAAVAREALHVAALREERRGQQVAGGLRALPAAALDHDLEHGLLLLAPAPPGTGRRESGVGRRRPI